MHDVLRGRGAPLDESTRKVMGRRLGHDLNQVRIYTDQQAAASGHVVNALAYMVGSSTVFDRGRCAPQQAEGRRLVAHELLDTIQPEIVIVFPSSIQGLQC